MSLEDIERKFWSEAASKPAEGVSAPDGEEKPISESSSAMPPAPPTPEPPPTATAPGTLPASAWGKESGKTGKGKRYLVFAVVGIAVVAGVLGGIYAFSKFFGGGSEDAVASVNVYAPVQIQRGVPFDARIEVTNEKEKPLSGKLKVVLSPGLLQSGAGLEIEEDIFMEPRGTYEKSVPLFAVGEVGTVGKISAEFTPEEGAQAKQEKEIYVRESGIRLTVERRQIQAENARFELKVRYENLSGVSFKDASIEVRYPQAFSFLSSAPAPSEGKGIWNLGEVKSKSEGVITILGVLSQSEAGSVKVPVLFKTRVGGEEFVLAEESALLSATQSPLLVTVLAGGREDYVATIGNAVPYSFRIKNNTDAGLSDVVVLVKFDGKVFDFKKVETRGTYNSSDRTVRWTAAQVPKFRVFNPKDTAEISVNIGLLKTFPMQTENDKNFLLKGVIEVTSPTVPHNSTADKTFISVPFEHKVAGDATMEVAAWRKDPWGTVNSGVLPLKSGAPTQYAVHWVLKNYSTDIKNVKITSALPAGVKFTGLVKSNAPTTPQVNDRTGLVEWSLPLVPAGKGVVNSPYEGMFQIEVLPNVTQKGRRARLLEATRFEATDTFTGLVISKKFDEIDSFIPNDPTFKSGDEMIIE